MTDEIEAVLQLVAEGHLDVERADRIIAALERTQKRDGGEDRAAPQPTVGPAPTTEMPTGGRGPRAIRIRVTEHGRQVVNLRLPLTHADAAVSMVPGLSSEHGQRLREAIAAGITGPLVDVEDEDGDGVVVSME